MKALLAALLALAALAQVGCAWRWHLGFDETWHVFMATVRPWSQMLHELRSEAHPPLLHLLLRALDPGPGDQLLARLPSLVGGVASAALVFLCARALGLALPVAALGGLVMAIARDPVSLAACTRGYALATAFTLVALRLALQPAPFTRRRGLALALAGALAVWTEYSALLVLVPLALLVLGDLLRRRDLLRHLPALAPAGVAALGLVLWMKWSHHRVAYNAIPEFLPDAGARLAFVYEGLARELSLFVPFRVPRPVAALATLALGAAAIAQLRATPARRAVAGVTCLALLAIVVLGALALYPLGGKMRHQYVLFPWLLLWALVGLEALARRWLGGRVTVAAGAAGLAVIVTALSAWRAGPSDEQLPQPLATALAPALAMRAADEPICVDSFTHVFVFGAQSGAGWRALSEIAGGSLFAVEDLRLVVWRSRDWSPPAPPWQEIARFLHGAGRATALWLQLMPAGSGRPDLAPARAFAASLAVDELLGPDAGGLVAVRVRAVR